MADVTPQDHLRTTESRMQAVKDALMKLDKDGLTDEETKRFDSLTAEFGELRTQREKFQRQIVIDSVQEVPLTSPRDGTRVAVAGSTDLETDPLGELRSNEMPGVRYRNPWDLAEIRTFNMSKEEVASELRSRALSAIEQMSGTNDKRRTAMTDIIEEYDDAKGTIARLALTTSNPHYVRAFGKAARGNMNFTPEEQKAVDRAMSLTDASGGYLVPFQLDPSVIITSDGSLNEIRKIARRVIATGDVWNGVSSGAVSWSWDAEASEVSDDSTTFAQPTIPVYKAAGFVPISIEALQDEQNVAGEVGRLLAFGKDTLEAAAFATGTGSAQPTGIVTAVTAQATSSATTDTFAIADVYALDDALPARYRPNASWLANRAIYNDIRAFDTSGGGGFWTNLNGDVPARLLNRPVYESEDMDGSITASATNLVLVYGDFSNYVIADRIGTTIEFIPHLFATGNNRPSGQRGWYAYYRVGADSVNDTAFEILDVT